MVDRWGGIDILVNNAGYGVIEPFLDSTFKAWTRTLALNVTALAMACKAAGRVMRDQRSGRIVNITSPGSRMALPDYTAYTASKAGVDSITRAAAVALAPYGVLVNSLAPGMMDTEMQRSTEADLARVNGRNDLQAFLDERTRRVPLGRRAEISEVAEAVVWLALDAPGLHDRRTAQHVRRPRQGLTRMLRNSPPGDADIGALKRRATNLRRHMLTMARGQGQGYIGQGLGIADVLAALYFHELRYDPTNVDWAGARPLPAVDRPLFDRAVGGAGRSRHPAGRRTVHLRRRRQPAGDVDARHDARRRDDRRLARPRPGAGCRAGARPAAAEIGGARLRRTVRRRDAGRLDLGGGDVGQPFQARRAGRAGRLQRHPGRRAGGARHGAGRRQMARLRLGASPRSTATTWTRSSAR